MSTKCFVEEVLPPKFALQAAEKLGTALILGGAAVHRCYNRLDLNTP
jgi:hypothetical protein